MISGTHPVTTKPTKETTMTTGNLTMDELALLSTDEGKMAIKRESHLCALEMAVAEMERVAEDPNVADDYKQNLATEMERLMLELTIINQQQKGY